MLDGGSRTSLRARYSTALATGVRKSFLVNGSRSLVPVPHHTTYAPIAIVDWTNEEGARFPPAMLGSGVWAGAIEQEYAYVALFIALRPTLTIRFSQILNPGHYVSQHDFPL